ncbi:unnamed protein product, partial [marine sediment metagenome]
VGKKSDILLLYSVAMILFAVLGVAGNLGLTLITTRVDAFFLLGAVLIVEVFVLFLSLKLSTRILSIR